MYTLIGQFQGTHKLPFTALVEICKDMTAVFQILMPVYIYNQAPVADDGGCPVFDSRCRLDGHAVQRHAAAGKKIAYLVIFILGAGIIFLRDWQHQKCK